MRIFPPELEIGETEGFTAAKDIFGRKELGEGLTNVVSVVADPMVIALDGQWGSGKTTFLKMWAGELRKRGFPVVFFDAFENDYQDDAFAALAGQIIALTDTLKKANTPAAKRFTKQALAAGRVLLRSSIKIGTRVATAGALDAVELAEAGKAIAGEASDLADRYLGELLTKQKEQKATLQTFRDSLAGLPVLLTQKPASSEGKQALQPKPLIFIVDELDRCRPVFALALLERIKHFFAVPNVHFVLGTHLGQLCNSVVAAYGPGIDAQTYLQKFIHLSATLEDDSQFENEHTVVKFLNHLVRVMELQSDGRGTVETAVKFIRYVAIHRDLSLRTIERVMTVLALAAASANKKQFCPAAILGGLCLLKVAWPAMYRKAKAGTLVFDDVEPMFGFQFWSGSAGEHATQWWRFSTDSAADGPLMQEMEQSLFKYDLDRSRVVSFVANVVVDRLNLQQQ